MTDSQQHYLLIINGKSAGNPALREAVNEQRQAGMLITVRATWEGGDAADIAEQSGAMGITHVIACGGDGTVSEVMNGLMRLPHDRRPALGIVPLAVPMILLPPLVYRWSQAPLWPLHGS